MLAQEGGVSASSDSSLNLLPAHVHIAAYMLPPHPLGASAPNSVRFARHPLVKSVIAHGFHNEKGLVSALHHFGNSFVTFVIVRRGSKGSIGLCFRQLVIVHLCIS